MSKAFIEHKVVMVNEKLIVTLTFKVGIGSYRKYSLCVNTSLCLSIRLSVLFVTMGNISEFFL